MSMDQTRGILHCMWERRKHTAHIWRCPHLVLLWKSLDWNGENRVPATPETVSYYTHICGWLLDWFQQANDEDRALGMQVMYHMWLAHNDRRDTQIFKDTRAMRVELGMLLNSGSLCTRCRRECLPMPRWSDGTDQERYGSKSTLMVQLQRLAILVTCCFCPYYHQSLTC